MAKFYGQSFRRVSPNDELFTSEKGRCGHDGKRNAETKNKACNHEHRNYKDIVREKLDAIDDVMSLQSWDAACRLAPTIIIRLPVIIDHRLPSPSATIGTKGKEQMAPAKYIADMTPRRTDLG